jgi:membrane glycosyltransferase
LTGKPPFRHPWELWGYIRRAALMILIVGPTAFAAWTMFPLLPFRERPVLSHVMILLFAVLFAWISVGFWSSLAGFFVLIMKRDRFSVAQALPPKGAALELPDGFKTALVFPIYN